AACRRVGRTSAEAGGEGAPQDGADHASPPQPDAEDRQRADQPIAPDQIVDVALAGRLLDGPDTPAREREDEQVPDVDDSRHREDPGRRARDGQERRRDPDQPDALPPARPAPRPDPPP